MALNWFTDKHLIHLYSRANHLSGGDDAKADRLVADGFERLLNHAPADLDELAGFTYINKVLRTSLSRLDGRQPTRKSRAKSRPTRKLVRGAFWEPKPEGLKQRGDVEPTDGVIDIKIGNRVVGALSRTALRSAIRNQLRQDMPEPRNRPASRPGAVYDGIFVPCGTEIPVSRDMHIETAASLVEHAIDQGAVDVQLADLVADEVQGRQILTDDELLQWLKGGDSDMLRRPSFRWALFALLAGPSRKRADSAERVVRRWSGRKRGPARKADSAATTKARRVKRQIQRGIQDVRQQLTWEEQRWQETTSAEIRKRLFGFMNDLLRAYGYPEDAADTAVSHIVDNWHSTPSALAAEATCKISPAPSVSLRRLRETRL